MSYAAHHPMIETLRTFTALSEEFVELFMKHHPIAATEAGIHDYDALLPDDSPGGLRERAAWLRDLEQRLVASVPWEELPTEPRVDYALLCSRIAALRADLEEVRVPQKNPSLYLGRAFRGIHLLLTRNFAPLDERKEAAVARLMAIPDYFAAAQPNLDIVPPALLEVALETAASGPAFVDDVVRMLMRSFPGEAERLEHAGGRARAGFLQFQEYLEKVLRPKAGGTFAIGERWLDFKLEREHLLPYQAVDLDRIGRDQVEHTRLLLEEEAKRIDPDKTWRELVEEGRHRRPEPNWLREAYTSEVERARRFVVEKRLAPIPEGERLEIVDTPIFDRPTTPYAGYQPPAPFDSDLTGFFHVTPIDLRRSKEAQSAQLAEHCTPVLPVVALHETYPGHHLQVGHANRAATRLRRLSHSDVYSEGWALYCEDLMWEQGFFESDPLTRLFQLKDLLWRACRMVADVGLHTGRMTLEEAERYLIEDAMLEGGIAAAEVRRYAAHPTWALSFLAGKMLLLDIRDEARRRLGARFDLHDFHAALLASGSLPPALVREEIWERLGLA